MREKELRARAAKRRTFGDGTWDYLCNRGYVDEALNKDFDEEAVQYIVNEIDALAEAYPYEGSRVPTGKTDTDDLGENSDDEQEDYFELELGDYERQRQRAHAEVLARLAGKNREVIEFRQHFLSGELLTTEQAYSFLESPATRYFSLEFLEALGVSLIEYKAEVVEHDEGWGKPEIDQRVAVRFDPSGTVKRAQYAPHWVPVPEDVTIHSRVCTYADQERTQPKHPNQWPLTYRDREGFKATVYPWPGSVLHELRWRSNKLARLYRWKEEDMVWVFLTGEAPKLSALKLTVRDGVGGAQISLTAAPWISAEVLKQNFEKAQEHILVKNPRELPSRSLAVLRFVEKVMRTEGKRPSWSELLSRWNMDHPEWTYKSWRGFAQTYRRTLDNVAHSPFRFPQTRPSPKAEKRYREMRERLLGALDSHVEKHGNRWPNENDGQSQDRS